MISKFLKFPLALAMVALLLVACNKDNETEPELTETEQITTNPTQIQSLAFDDVPDCYEIVYPISFLYEDGTTQIANSEDDLYTIFDAEPYPINIEFPINLNDPATGETITVTNENELITLLEACDFDDDDYDDDWDDENNPCDSIDFNFGELICYNFVFPISLVLEDGTAVTAQSADDLAVLFDVDNAPEDFVYPINLEDIEDGTLFTANNEDELEQLLEDCFGFDDDYDDDEYWEENPVYYLTFVSIAGDSLNAENCYTYVYPISVLTENGETLTVNSDDELLAIIFSNEDLEDFVYPVQVINNEDGTTITLNDEDEVEDVAENCE